MRDFFISFNKEDKEWAEWIAWSLEDAGYSVWYQGWDFRAGANFGSKMHQALKESKQLIAVLSENFLKSEFTESEWVSAFVKDPRGQDRKLLPVRVKECEPDGLLKGIIYTDLVGLPEPDAKIALLAALRESGRPSKGPMFPGAINQKQSSARITESAKPFPGPVVDEKPGAPNLGAVVSRSCNRVEQRDQFKETFERSVRECPSHPQVFVVHGPVKERHKSLVMRFQETTIQDYANYVSKTKSAVAVWQCEWSYKLDVDVANQQLIESLIRRSHQDDPRFRFEKHEHSSESFREALAPLGNTVVIVQHKIETQKWTTTTGKLIKTYLKFWDEVKRGADIPQFIIFLNVIYPAAESAPGWKLWEKWSGVRHWLSKRQISTELKEMGNSPGRLPGARQDAIFCLYTLLNELPRVGLSDLVQWFEDHNLGRNEVAWETQSKNIFRKKGWRFDERKSMAEIESALDEFIEVMQASF